MDNLTLCDVGCLVTSTSMAIGGHNISVAGATSSPQSLNAWLRAHGGYDGANDLYESAVPGVNPVHIQWNESRDMHTTNDVPLADIIGLLKSGERAHLFVSCTLFLISLLYDPLLQASL